MAEVLTLTTPVSTANIVTWDVKNIYLDKETPSIKVTLANNLGQRYVYRAVVENGTVTAADIIVGLSFINQGKFKTVQSKSLEKWLIDKIKAELPQFAGTVSGTEF